MVFCTYCGQSFTRDEHLERHILTHTNVKPFKCFTCHMSFARRDLLQRHYTVHGRDQNNQEGLPANPMIPKSAGRTPIACTNCAKTKTKCDKKFPCSRCASRNLKCTLRPTRRVSRNVNRLPVPVNGAADPPSPPEQNGQTQTQTVTPDASKGNSPQLQPQRQLSTESVSHTPEQSHTPEPQQAPAEHANGFFRQSPTSFKYSPGSDPSQKVPTVMSPLPTPGTIVGNGFMASTPMSGYEDFAATSRSASDQSSPRFMMDWAQLQFSTAPPQFEPIRSELMIAGGMGLTLDGLSRDAIEPGMLTMIPDFAHTMPPNQTPLATPRMSMSTSLTDMEITGSTHSGIYCPSTRGTSISECSTSELPAVIKAQDSWNCFRSSPTVASASCPRTARLHLEKLEQSLKNHDGWNSWQPAWEDTDTTNDYLNVAPLMEHSKDKLLVITQSFLNKALEIHRDSNTGTPSRGGSPAFGNSNFVTLPPIKVLQYFLRAYANTFERFFPLTACGALNMNDELMHPLRSEKASSLLTLLMIAAGSMSIPSMDARWLQGGLTEACRISLFDLIETNISMASDHTVLHSALLFTAAAAWGGDKWHMNIAMGQRGMYTAMLRHSGALEPEAAVPIMQHSSPEGLWQDWLQHEGKSRLIYSWAMVDQDLSFFQDSSPLFAVTEFGAPMPDSDRLWHAKSAAEWSTVFNQVHEFSGGYSSVGSGARPLSLRDLFRQFLEDEILSRGIELTPLHLRLLLHPLQALVCQYRQLESCFSSVMATSHGGNATNGNTASAASSRARSEELQVLLKRWQLLADRYTSAHPMCAMMQASLVMFHLISLNTVTNFPEIERLARREGLDDFYQQLLYLQKICVVDTEQTAFHAGQVLRLVRAMPANVRPPWWPAAIYRAGLVLWTISLAPNPSTLSPSTTNGLFPVPGPSVAVDSLAPDHPLLVRYLSEREGVPTLSKRDGTQMSLDHPFTVLSHCVEVLDEGVSNRFSDGIRNKLQKLATAG